MKVAGIIVEYNPFHKGHEYHIAETRRITGADFVVAVMSGNFTQRGIPACLDKFTRAECALACGADVVLELPFCYATGSAEYFAEGAVTLLSRLGIIDSLCFGTETDVPISIYTETATFLCEEPQDYKKALQDGLRSGMTFPEARAMAVRPYLSEDALALLASPNATLGLEYCKALLRKKSTITPYAITRIGSGYHDATVDGEGFSSATALRGLLTAGNHFPSQFLENIPAPAAAHLATKPYTPVFAEDFLLLYRSAIGQNLNRLSEYADISNELAGRMKKRFPTCDYEDFLAHLKTRQYTRTRVERCLLHLLLDVTKEAMDSFRKEETCYARILGFREQATPVLKRMKECATLPILTKLAQRNKRCNATENRLLSYDIAATDLYNQMVNQKYHVLFPDDFTYSMTNAGFRV